jgi:LysM domain-containing protein
MIYEPPHRPRRRRQQSILDSPVLSAVLVLAALGLAAVLFLPGLLAPGAPGPTSTARTAGGTPIASGPPPSPTFARPTPSPAPTFVTYVVQTGDSLNSIAKKFRTTARSIAWWNRGRYPRLDPQSPSYDPNTIRVGWILAVMPDTIVDDNNPPTPSPNPNPSPGPSPA